MAKKIVSTSDNSAAKLPESEPTSTPELNAEEGFVPQVEREEINELEQVEELKEIGGVEPDILVGRTLRDGKMITGLCDPSTNTETHWHVELSDGTTCHILKAGLNEPA